MAKEVSIDFTSKSNPKRRKRSQRDIDRYWNSRFNRFTKAGFTQEEASWAASKGLSPKKKQVKELIQARKAMVAYYMRHDFTREDAIVEASKDLESKLNRNGISELNLFYEVSP